MTTQTKKDFKIPDELMDIYQEMEISPVGLLKNYALNIVCGKIHKYEIKNVCFEKKYGQSLEEFRRKIDVVENEENFEWEDDLKDWEFAIENIKYWKKRQRNLKEILDKYNEISPLNLKKNGKYIVIRVY